MTEDGLRADRLTLRAGSREILRDLSFDLRPGELVVLVGASGSGKSLTLRALVGRLPAGVVQAAGSVTFRRAHASLTPSTERDWRSARGRLVDLVWQDGALDPLRTIGAQLREAARLGGASVDDACARAGLPPTLMSRHPHALSGGEAQRAALAIGFARGAPFLLADESTTGLDAAVERGVLRDVRRACDAGLAVLWVTHDLRTLAPVADRVIAIGPSAYATTNPPSATRAEPVR